MNDVAAMREGLIAIYGFDPRDIVTLTDERATRLAIKTALEAHLLDKSGKGDVAFFAFSGHGAQVPNSRSDEPDKLDESIVPADSRLGADDIRDKELRRIFNAILDRGARLSVVLDTCHSGSGYRSGDSPRMRGIRPAPGDVADPATGPRPEDRGAIIVAGAQDHEPAFETRDEQKRYRGAFSWAFLHALRDAAPGEPAIETFLRARARLIGTGWPQYPAFAANGTARQQPFLGERTDRRNGRAAVSVETVRRDGTIVIAAGWVNGLTVGTELRQIDGGGAIVEVTKLRDLGRSEGRARSAGVKAGSLLEIVSWRAEPGRTLRVQIPQTASSLADLIALAGTLKKLAAERGIAWIEEPQAKTPSHVLRWNGSKWQLVRMQTMTVATMRDAATTVRSLPRNATLWVEWPVPAAIARRISIGPGTRRDAVQPVDRAGDPGYVLAGRFTGKELEYAWVKPFAFAGSQPENVLPPRTDWEAAGSRKTPQMLTDAALRLHRIQAWQSLDAPPVTAYPYRLALRRAADGEPVTGHTLPGNEQYALTLRSPATLHAWPLPRYVYIFVVDSFGRSTLLFPRNASVENRFPIPPAPGAAGTIPPSEIALGAPAAFRTVPPYGLDTYILFTTSEPLSDPWVLEWDGVRTRDGTPSTPLEALLASVGAAERSARSLRVPANWSIVRETFRTIQPAKRERAAVTPQI